MLVVDDDPNAVELIALRVAGMAGNVLRAYGGREAIEIARRELPDVIVLDLMMPDVNGFDVVAALTKSRYCPHPGTGRHSKADHGRGSRQLNAQRGHDHGEGGVRLRPLYLRSPPRDVRSPQGA